MFVLENTSTEGKTPAARFKNESSLRVQHLSLSDDKKDIHFGVLPCVFRACVRSSQDARYFRLVRHVYVGGDQEMSFLFRQRCDRFRSHEHNCVQVTAGIRIVGGRTGSGCPYVVLGGRGEVESREGGPWVAVR